VQYKDPSVTEEQVQQFFGEIDVDKAGILTKAEFFERYHLIQV
jgi:hypothetical protein